MSEGLREGLGEEGSGDDNFLTFDNAGTGATLADSALAEVTGVAAAAAAGETGGLLTSADEGSVRRVASRIDTPIEPYPGSDAHAGPSAEPHPEAYPEPDPEPYADPSAATLASGRSGTAALRLFLADVLDAADRGSADWLGPLPPGGPEAVARAVAASGFGALPAAGRDPFDVLAALGRLLAWGAADPSHPHCAAHLHTPPLAVSVAAETLVAALNQSLASWDQSPAAGEIERAVVATLAESAGYDPLTSAGVLTSGATESTLMGLLLARDETLRRRCDADPDLDGLPATAAGKLRIVTSELAHVSVARDAAFLGLGERCVVPVPTDLKGRMRPDGVARALERVTARGEIPMAIVATAGTTDHGAVDPIGALAALARPVGAWLHVDAAYGGGLLVGSRPDARLAALAQADSVALDLHSLGWQPAPAAAFLTRRAAVLRTLERRVAHLNPHDDEQAGYPGPLGRSLRTTRRADAVKIAAAFAALGREGFQRLTDRCLDLARYAAAAIAKEPRLELTAEPELTTVLFRYLAPEYAVPEPAGPERAEPEPQRGLIRAIAHSTAHDHLNAALRRELLRAGRAVLGRTELPRDRPGVPPGRVRLKLTLLNPHTTEQQIDELLAAVCEAGDKVPR